MFLCSVNSSHHAWKNCTRAKALASSTPACFERINNSRKTCFDIYIFMNSTHQSKMTAHACAPLTYQKASWQTNICSILLIFTCYTKDNQQVCFRLRSCDACLIKLGHHLLNQRRLVVNWTVRNTLKCEISIRSNIHLWRKCILELQSVKCRLFCWGLDKLNELRNVFRWSILKANHDWPSINLLLALFWQNVLEMVRDIQQNS